MSPEPSADPLACAPRARRQLLFLRDFRAMSGGHLKVWHYFKHAARSEIFEPRVFFTPDSRLDGTNPWIDAGVRPLPHWCPEAADAIFLGGMDWTWIDQHPAGTGSRPVLNIIQGLRHVDPLDPRHDFLQRAAIRISVNPILGQKLRASLRVRGPVLDVPMGLEMGHHTPGDPEGRGIVISAVKHAAKGKALAERLGGMGIPVSLLDRPLPRDRFLDTIRAAKVVVCLPHLTEGFYLPALEAMALGRIVVCPDSGGNRIYLDDSINAYVPDTELDALVESSRVAFALDGEASARMRAAAMTTAAAFPMEAERTAFLTILSRLDELWHGCA